MGNYIQQSHLEGALSVATVIAACDDDRDGAADASVIAQIIENAEAEVDSFLFGYYTVPLPAPIDRIVKLAALDFAISFLFRRHPEYVRTFGNEPRSMRLYENAVARMKSIQAGAQALPDTSATVGRAKNIAKPMVNTEPRMSLPNSNGTGGTGDF